MCAGFRKVCKNPNYTNYICLHLYKLLRITKLQNLNKFLKNLKIPEINCKTHFTTANADATSSLDKESRDQLVLARPEMEGMDPTDATKWPDWRCQDTP